MALFQRERPKILVFKLGLKICLLLLVSMAVGCGDDDPVAPPKASHPTPQFVLQWGVPSPTGIAVGGGNVYVVDQGYARIQKFDSVGTFLTTWGSQGTGEGQFNTPVGIAVDASGNVYVADANNHRIQKFR